MILEILRATPAWVFALFAYLLWMGVWRLRTRVRNLRSVWIAPAIFIAWGLSGLAGRPGPLSLTLACWLIGAALGGLLGYRLEPTPLVEQGSGRVRQPGSVIPLLRNLALFGAHYLLHVAAAFAPAAADRLMSGDIAVSGLGAGYFIGWAVRFARNRLAAADPATDPIASAAADR